MSSSTPNLNLVLPVGGEHVSRAIINENNTKIDTFAGTANSSLNTLSEQIGALNNRFTLLAANVDLNTVKTSGLYGTRANNSHSPLANIGQLVVIQYSSDWVTQIWASGATNARGTLFVRNYYDGTTWSDWQRIDNVHIDYKSFDDVSDFNDLSSRFYDTIAFTVSGTARSNLPMSTNASLIVSGSGDYMHVICIRANGEIYTRNRVGGTWDTNWKPIPNLLVNETLDAGTSKTYSFATGRLYQIMCAHPYGQGYFAIYAGGPAGAARLTEIKTSSNVTVSVASNANSITITATGQATYVRIIEY